MARRMRTGARGAPRALGFGEQRLPGCATMSAFQPCVEQPARLGEDAKLLTAEARGGFGVQHERDRARRDAATAVIRRGSYTGAVLVADLIERFTYVGIFLVLFVAGLGVPIPEEAPILAAGVLASQEIIRWWLALAVCFVGVLAGDIVLYWVGHHWGEHILEWRLTRCILTPRARGDGHSALPPPRDQDRLHRALRGGLSRGRLPDGRHRRGFRSGSSCSSTRVAALVGVPLGFGVAYLFTDQLPAILHGVHRFERLARCSR